MADISNKSSRNNAASRLESGHSIEDKGGFVSEATSDLEIFSKEVLSALISDNLPPTPNNFSLYFDRILEEKSESLRRQIGSILEMEDSNEDEQNLELEKSLKLGFSSVKSILQLSATLYKNMTLMEKILEKRQEEIKNLPAQGGADQVLASLTGDVSKLSGILNKQVTHMKDLYNDTANIVKQVENETIFDNQYGVYNKRYLLNRLTQEYKLIDEFNHKSSLIMVQLSTATIALISSEKAKGLMIRTVARLLLKTSRRSDIVAHYGEGIFSMLLKHTDTESAKRASDRLYELVSSSNFFLGDQEIQLLIAIGIAELDTSTSVEDMLLGTLDAMNSSNDKKDSHYVIYNDK